MRRDLVELGHQVDARVKPARRVDDHGVAAPRLPRRNRVEHDRRRIRARLGPNDVDLGARRPDLQLFDRRRAERVGGADQRPPP